VLKLNLGCGSKHWPGFVNIDGISNNRSVPDLLHDLNKPLPYDDGSVDEIHAIHLIEHFYRWEVPGILADWTRALKPGGLLVLECPSLERVLAAFNYYIGEGQPVGRGAGLRGIGTLIRRRDIGNTVSERMGAGRIGFHRGLAGLRDVTSPSIG
jgi:SAM-dependent methyltransferase